MATISTKYEFEIRNPELWNSGFHLCESMIGIFLTGSGTLDRKYAPKSTMVNVIAKNNKDSWIILVLRFYRNWSNDSQKVSKQWKMMRCQMVNKSTKITKQFLSTIIQKETRSQSLIIWLENNIIQEIQNSLNNGHSWYRKGFSPNRIQATRPRRNMIFMKERFKEVSDENIQIYRFTRVPFLISSLLISSPFTPCIY